MFTQNCTECMHKWWTLDKSVGTTWTSTGHSSYYLYIHSRKHCVSHSLSSAEASFVHFFRAVVAAGLPKFPIGSLCGGESQSFKTNKGALICDVTIQLNYIIGGTEIVRELQTFVAPYRHKYIHHLFEKIKNLVIGPRVPWMVTAIDWLLVHAWESFGSWAPQANFRELMACPIKTWLTLKAISRLELHILRTNVNFLGTTSARQISPSR